MKKEISRKLLDTLMDQSVSTIERIKLAEKARNEQKINYKTALELLNVPNVTYCRHLQVIRSGNEEIYNFVSSGAMSVTAAVALLKMPTYPFKERLERMGATIILDAGAYVVYEFQQQRYLGVAYSVKGAYKDELKKQFAERLYLIDNEPYAVETIKNLINEGYLIGRTLRIVSPNRKRKGTLCHHLYAGYHNLDVNEILPKPVSFKVKSANNAVTDLRISNLSGPKPSISGQTKIYKRGKDMVIVRKVDGLVTYLDYSPDLYRVLTSYGCLHTKTDDDRLALYIDREHSIYLYHLRMIEHLYGLPRNINELIANIERLRDEYFSKGMCIDHLDNDCCNNRLSNLMVMSIAENTSKNGIVKVIRNLGYPFFYWAERYDDTAIKMRTGYFSQFKKPVFMTEGVFSVKEFLHELQTFADQSRENVAVFDAFEKLDKQNSEWQLPQ